MEVPRPSLALPRSRGRERLPRLGCFPRLREEVLTYGSSWNSPSPLGGEGQGEGEKYHAPSPALPRNSCVFQPAPHHGSQQLHGGLLSRQAQDGGGFLPASSL